MRSCLWGIFLIVSGIVLVLKYQFNLSFSAGRVIFGLFIITAGISILIGNHNYSIRDEQNIIFNEGSFVGGSQSEYNVVFGKGNIDLSNVPLDDIKRNIEINTVFGNTVLILPKDKSTLVKASAAFGATYLPDGTNAIGFSDREYHYNVDSKKDADITIELNTVFGRTDVIQR